MIIAEARKAELVKVNDSSLLSISHFERIISQPTQEKSAKLQPTEKRDPYNLDKVLPLIHDLSHKEGGVIQISKIDARRKVAVGYAFDLYSYFKQRLKKVRKCQPLCERSHNAR